MKGGEKRAHYKVVSLECAKARPEEEECSKKNCGSVPINYLVVEIGLFLCFGRSARHSKRLTLCLSNVSTVKSIRSSLRIRSDPIYISIFFLLDDGDDV